MQIQTAAEKLLSLSPSVRVVSVCDLKGNLVYSARPKKISILLSKSQSLASLRAAAKDWRSRKKLAKTLGPCKYVVAEYGAIKRMILPAGKDHLLYVTTNAAYDHNKILRKVRTFK